MKNKNRVLLTKEQKAQREEALEQLHPGYFDRKLRLNVMLGTVLFARGFYTALSVVLGVIDMPQVAVNVFGLFFTYSCYSWFISGYWRAFAGILLLVRLSEFLFELIPAIPYVLQMYLIGIIWWVTMVLAVLLDMMFLAYLLFGKMPRMQQKDGRKLYSGEAISLQKQMEQIQDMTQNNETDEEL